MRVRQSGLFQRLIGPRSYDASAFGLFAVRPPSVPWGLKQARSWARSSAVAACSGMVEALYTQGGAEIVRSNLGNDYAGNREIPLSANVV